MSHGDIEIGETAERDIDGIAADVEARGLSVGYRFYAAVHADFERLSVFSGLGPACEVDDPKYSGVRSLPVSGF
jgi:plasmid stabilization system protein ParE